MNTKPKNTIRTMRLYGLICGLVAGLAFALSCWGFDAYMLAQSHAAYPWMKLAIGGSLCLLAGGLAGWLTALVDRMPVGVVLWVLVARFFAWLTIFVPFQAAPRLMSLLDPSLSDWLNYPLYEGFSAKMNTSFYWLAIAAALLGLLQSFLIEQAVHSAAPVSRATPFILFAIIMLLSAQMLDDLVSAPLRTPLVTIDNLVQFGIDHKGEEVDSELARFMRLKAIAAIEDLIESPRRLMIGKYNEALDRVDVLIDFDGQWASCSTSYNMPVYCKPVSAP